MIYAQGQKGASIFSLFFVRAMALHAAGDAAGERETHTHTQTGSTGSPDRRIRGRRHIALPAAGCAYSAGAGAGAGEGVHCLEAAGRCLCEGMRVCDARAAGEYCMSEGWFCSRRNRYGAE